MLLRCLGRNDWCLLAVGAVLVIAQVYLDLRIPEYMSDITRALRSGDAEDLARRFGIPMIACASLSLLASVGSAACITYATTSLGARLRAEQFRRVQEFSSADAARFSPASLVTRSTNDVYQLQRFLSMGLTTLMSAPLLAAWALYKISSSAIEWTAAMAAACLAVLAIIAVAMAVTMRYFRRIQWLTDGINREVKDELTGIRVVHAYGAEEYQHRRLVDCSDELLDNNLKAFRNMAVMYPSAGSVANFLTIAIYWIGTGLIFSAGSETEQVALFSDMIVFTSYAQFVLSSMMRLSEIVRDLPRAMVCYGRIKEVVETEPSVKGGDTTQGADGARGEVRFEHVDFSYEGSKEPALRDVSFTVGSGETLAVMGPSGGGKSTLLSLILRLYDVTGGTVYVDGVDVREWDQEALHSRMGYVSQKPVLFPGSVRENVDLDGDRSDEEILSALDVAQARSFVDERGGVGADVYQSGRNLSGGQRQRLSIARAVCRRPEILVLDDPFSALDQRTERKVREGIRDASAGSTVIVSAQKIGTALDADRILVLDCGRVVGLGTHDELMGSCPVYREIVESQTEGSRRRSPCHRRRRNRTSEGSRSGRGATGPASSCRTSSG